MRRLLILLVGFLCSVYAGAESLSIGRLFTRPYLWGTSPDHLKWSQRNRTLVFLWTPAGRRFLDLCAYQPQGERLVRLTNLESPAEDEKYPMPSAGIGAPF